MEVARESVSLAQARRIALAAQGFADPRPTGRIDRRHLRRVLARTQLLQIDSVNVAVRAHDAPAFSRLGPHPRDLLHTAAYRHRDLFEYWGHEASYLPVPLQPLFRWRMARAERGEMWGGLVNIARQRPDLIADVVRRLETDGPVRAGDLDAQERRHPGTMWSWSDAKKALEWLFWTGRVSVLERAGNFERRYDLTERVLPRHVLAQPTPSEQDAHRELLRLAGRAHGIGTLADLADYFRIKVPQARPRIAELVEEGALRPVDVEGWKDVAYLDPQAQRPRRIRANALLSPFDPVVWFRPRAERLFDFHYRIEIYVPAAKRRYGYYVLPFLHGDRIAARVDLKADRQAGALLVKGAWGEAHAHPEDTAVALAEELHTMARWLGLNRVTVSDIGDLAGTLQRAARASC